MGLILQVWGAAFYLLNKILFVLAENKESHIKRQIKITGWIFYILGVPAWVIILIGNQDWIAASVEAGGIPSMLLGLYNTYHDYQKQNKYFNAIALISTYFSLAFGVIYSLLSCGGITSITQILEIGVMLGFLLGGYFMAKNNPSGWLFFMLMNLSLASLMHIQEKPILMVQQVLSFCFVFYGFIKTKSR